MRAPDTFKVVTEVAADGAETAEFVFGEMGALGSVEEEGSDPGSKRIAAYFDAKGFERKGLRDRVAESFSPFPELANAWIEVELEPAKDWNASFREHFKHFTLARGFVVVPSWEKYEAADGERTIDLDPGMAFGTGLHETTSLSADAIISAVGSGKPPSSILDVGTGSGILSIVAGMLGVKRIAAVDIDEDALEAAKANLAKNGLGDAKLGNSVGSVRGKFEIVVANILLGALLELRDEIAKRVAPGGTLILSGITHDQEAELIDAYREGFTYGDISRRGEWSAIVLHRES